MIVCRLIYLYYFDLIPNIGIVVVMMVMYFNSLMVMLMMMILQYATHVYLSRANIIVVVYIDNASG